MFSPFSKQTARPWLVHNAGLIDIGTVERRVTIEVRAMRETDMEAVLAVQAACYPPAMQEAEQVVRARLLAAAPTTLVACVKGSVSAYAFAYPSRLGSVTPLGAVFTLPAAPDTLYLHDLAVLPAAHGRGLAQALLAGLFARARAAGLRHAALVSVQGSQAFWEARGYRPGVATGQGLATYPGRAVYMTRTLAGHDRLSSC